MKLFNIEFEKGLQIPPTNLVLNNVVQYYRYGGPKVSRGLLRSNDTESLKNLDESF